MGELMIDLTADDVRAVLGACGERITQLCADVADVSRHAQSLADQLERFGTYAPCPCGAWMDRLDKRPHVGGCPVDQALHEWREWQEAHR